LRKLHVGQRRSDRKLADIERRLNGIDERFSGLEEDIDARFDSVDESLGELLDLVYSMIYGGAADEGQPTLWGSDEEDDDETEEEA